MRETILKRVRERLAVEAGLAASITHDTLVLVVKPDAVLTTVQTLKNRFGMDLFLDVTAVDWPQRELRFDVVYHFYTTQDHIRIRLKTAVPEADPSVDSLLPLYGAAGFMERECHEMYGILFRNNLDLRPILLYEGFTGYPLRKDYPKDKEQPLVHYEENPPLQPTPALANSFAKASS